MEKEDTLFMFSLLAVILLVGGYVNVNQEAIQQWLEVLNLKVGQAGGTAITVGLLALAFVVIVAIVKWGEK